MGAALEVQGRGGLATSGGDVARAPTPLRGNFIFDTIYTLCVYQAIQI